MANNNNSQQFQAQFSLNGQQVNNEIDRIRERIEAVDKEMAHLYETGKKQNKDRLLQLESERRGLQEQEKDMKSLQKVVNDASKSMDKMSPRELKKTMRDINSAIEKGAIKRGTHDWQEAMKVLAKCDSELKKINAEIRAAGETPKGGGIAGKISSFFGSGIGKVAGIFGAVTTAGAAFTKVMGDLISKNREFEQANADLASVLGTTRSEIGVLTEDAKRLGSSTAFTASEVTQLQTELAKLGFSQQEILDSTEGVLNFAAATGAALPDAASVAGAALRAFGLDASEMERVVSTMAVATANSALDFSKLQTSMSIVSPVAKQFGFTIEDTVALLGKLSDAGFDASSAATATRNIFLYMSDPASKLSKALGGPIKSLNDLAPAFQKLTDRGIDLAEMLDLTDKRAVSAFATLVSQGNGLVDLRDKITDCNDALQDMVDERMNTLEGSTKKLSSAWEGLMLTFSNSTGIMKSVVDWATKMTEKLTRLFSTISEKVNRDVTSGSAAIVKERKPFWQQQLERLGISKASSEQLDKYIDSYEKSLGTAEGEAKKIRDRIGNLEEALKLGIGTRQSIELLGGEMTQKEAKKEIEELTNKLIDATVDVERANFFLDRLHKQKDSLTESGNGGGGGNGKGYEARMKAQYDAEAKQQIAELDRMAMTEEEYENKVFEIRRAALERTKGLYKEGTKEYSQQVAAIATLETNHQTKLLSIQKKGNKEQEKEQEKANKKQQETEAKNISVIQKIWQELRKKQREKESLNKSTYIKALEAEKAQLEAHRSSILSIYGTLTDIQKRQADVILDQLRNMLGKINDEIKKNPFNWDAFFGGKKTEDGKKIPGFDAYYASFQSSMKSLGSLVDAQSSEEEARVNKKYEALIEAAEKNGKDTTELEKQKDAEINAIKKDAAKKQFTIDMLTASTDMAKSILKTMSAYIYPYNLIMAALDSAAFGIQIATLKKNYEAQIAGYYDGGYTGYSGNYRQVAGVTHEGEFVANHNTVNNPEIRPMLDMLDYAQKHNAEARLTQKDLAMAAAYRQGGYYSGGYAGGAPTVNVSPNVTVQRDDNYARMAQLLDMIYRNGIDANVYVDDVNKAQRRKNQLITNKSRIA